MGGENHRSSPNLIRANSAKAQCIGKPTTSPANTQKTICRAQHVQPEPSSTPRTTHHHNIPNSTNAQTIRKGGGRHTRATEAATVQSLKGTRLITTTLRRKLIAKRNHTRKPPH